MSQWRRNAHRGQPELDAFGRSRTAEPATLFDSKQISDNAPLFWDDQETSGTGTTSTHSVNRASSAMAVTASTAGTRIRQTFQRFNYQPGKSQLVMMTGVLGVSSSGLTHRIGYYDDDNGLFFEHKDGVMSVVVRSKVTGDVVDTAVAQASWNITPLTNTNHHDIIDLTMAQIFVIDFEWLGVGRVRFGFVIEGEIRYVHEVLNANRIANVYMSTPNLPLRYEIANDGNGPAATLEAMCASVISEGGQEPQGKHSWVSTEGADVSASAADTLYAVVGVKHQVAPKNQTAIVVEGISMIAETNDDFEWMLMFNPTVAGAFTYANVADSHVMRALGATANTITNGTPIAGGWVAGGASAGAVTVALDNALRIGHSIAGVSDEMVLCVRPLSTNLTIQGGMTLRELI